MIWLDPVLETNAPFYGEVLTLTDPLAQYRMHNTNGYQRQELSPDYFLEMIRTFEKKLIYIEKRAASWGEVFDAETAKRHSIWYLECMMSAAKLSLPSAPNRVAPLRILGRALRAAPNSPYGRKQRAILLAWLTAVALAPRKLAEDLITFRFIVGRRPRWLERFVRILAR